MLLNHELNVATCSWPFAIHLHHFHVDIQHLNTWIIVRKRAWRMDWFRSCCFWCINRYVDGRFWFFYVQIDVYQAFVDCECHMMWCMYLARMLPHAAIKSLPRHATLCWHVLPLGNLGEKVNSIAIETMVIVGLMVQLSARMWRWNISQKDPQVWCYGGGNGHFLNGLKQCWKLFHLICERVLFGVYTSFKFQSLNHSDLGG